MQRPSWSGFQFPFELPFECIGGRLRQIDESPALIDVGLNIMPGQRFPVEFPLEFEGESVAVELIIDVQGRTQTTPMRLDVGTSRFALTTALFAIGISRSELVPLTLDIWLPYEPTLLILDRDRQIRAVLPDVSWSYERRINEATELSFTIPRQVVAENIGPDDGLAGFFRENKAQYAEIAAFAQVLAGGVLKASGKIVGRTLGDVISIQAYTEEILLESNLTPAQYGKVWDGWDLADVARDLLNGWQTIRVKAQSQWQSYMVDSSHIDLTTEPGTVMLAKQPNGRYYPSGYITLAFGSGEIRDFKRWDRIRWSADSADPVKTTIQYGYDGANWSQEFDGGLPEEVGVGGLGDTETLYVRVNLYTNDTESEGSDGNPVGVTPVVYALELIARTEGQLVAGNIPDVAGLAVKGIDADHASALEVLVDACEQTGWEFQVVNGALNIAKNLGMDKTRAFILRGGTNMEITSLGDDDSELVNVLTAIGPGSGLNRMEITLRDEESIAAYGEYPAAVEFDAITLTELETKAQEYLASHNTPAVAFEVAAVFDYEHEPVYAVGDVVRVADPETGIVTTARIMSESREYGDNGLSVRLQLGRAALNLQAVLEGKAGPAKPIDPLTPAGVYARGVIKGIVVGCSAPKADWAYTECHVSTAKGFVPSTATLVGRGKQTRFDIPNLDPGVRYYARLIHVDNSGRRSEPSREVSAAAQYVPVEALPDYSIGVEKFVQSLRPPQLVTTLPTLPDPRYPAGSLVFPLDKKQLHQTDGNIWEPVGTGTITANEIMAGIIQAGGITAEYYSQLRNTLPYTYLDSLDAEHPLECDFFIPTATDVIVQVLLSARGLPYRAYSRAAKYWDAPFGTTGGPATNMTLEYWDYTTSTNSGSSVSRTESAGDSWDGTTPKPHYHYITPSAAPQGHTHTYRRLYSINGLNSHTHWLDTSHSHELEFGIYQGSSPTNVQLYIDNGSGYGPAISLGSSLNLCIELDLTRYVSGTGWKRLKFTSSTMGRIAAVLIVKVDITA